MWDEIASPFPNFNGTTVEDWELTNKSFHRSLYNEYNYLFMLGSKLEDISKGVHISLRREKQFQWSLVMESFLITMMS